MTPANRPELAERVTAEIRAEMARQRVTQTALADRLGWRQDYLSRRLTGRLALTVDELEAIARELGRPMGEFLDSLPAERSRT